MQDKVDAALAFGARFEFDLIDQVVYHRTGCLGAVWVACDDLGHGFQLAAIVLDDGGVCDNWFDLGELGLVGQQTHAAVGQLIGSGLQLFGWDAGDDSVGDPFFRLVDLCQLPIDVGAACDQAAALLAPCSPEFVEICGYHVGMQQVTSDSSPYAALESCVGDGRTVGAGACLTVGAAPPTIRRDDDHRAAAAAAAQLAREEPCLALALGMVAADVGEAVVDLVPCVRVDDPQLGNRPAHQLARFVHAGHPLARVRILAEGLPVVDDLTDIQAVVKDAVAPLAVPDNRVGAPFPAAG